MEENIKTEPVKEPVTEPVEEPVQTDDSVKKDEHIANLEKYIQELQLFSDQTKFNSLIYQGVSMILEKINKIESKLNGNQKQTPNKE